jgi:type IV pilus assembly protein PilC
MMTDELLFPLVFTQMLAVGERTGKLYETGLYLADYYEGELDTSTKSLSNILEPLMLIVMGGVVAFVALSIITPIYAYTSSLSK